jgi:hypothetical protein
MNVTLIVQPEPGAICDLQLLVWVKLLALGPLMATLLNVTVVLPWFFSKTDCGGLLVPTVWSAKLIVRGVSPITVPVPET